MAKRNGEQPRKRFSKSGHTSHQPRVGGPDTYQLPPAYEPPPRYEAPRQQSTRPFERGPEEPPPYRSAPRYETARTREPYRSPARSVSHDRPSHDRPSHDRPSHDRPPTDRDDVDPFGSPTYHHTPAASRPPHQPASVGRAAAGVGRAARGVTRKVITASESDGAKESGLTSLIWNQVLSYGTDAMVTVALAGTVFFGASAHAQRGNVLLYLLVTMAPFAVVAPVIGPVLDRFQHGRRWTMAGTAVGRAVLALIMAGHPTELLVLYPCALGSLVLSKAYGVVRAAAAPRLVPPEMTLTAANAKLTIFGLGSTLVLGGLVGAIIKLSGSYTAGLIVTAVGFAACAFFAVKLPKQVDSAVAAPRHPEEPNRPRRQDKVPPMARLFTWARRGFDPHLVVALQGESVLRLLSGLLTIYLAFYVESTAHGLTGVLELGGVVGAAGAGNFVGTAIGTRLAMAKPEQIIVASTVIAAVALLIGAATFTVWFAILAMFVCAVTNALSKIALDSLIQNDVSETLRSSAFARSETFLQLAWVIGAALGVVLPSHSTGDGAIALVVGAVITAAVSALVLLRTRANARTARPSSWQEQHASSGNVIPRSID